MVREDGCPGCDLCEGQDHHWLPEFDERTGEGYMACKHCDATREITDDDMLE